MSGESMMSEINRLALSSASVLITFVSPTYASDAKPADITPYVNFGAGLIDAQNRTDFNGVFSGVFRGGVELSPYFAFEAEGQIGLSKKTNESVFSNVRFDETTVKLDHQFGVYAVGRLPLSEAVSLQARAGYATYQSTASTDQFFEGANDRPIETTHKFDGVSLGFGGQFMFGADKLNGLRLDSSILFDVDDSPDEENNLPDINGIFGVSVSYVRKF